jgi:succinate dehydrogenase / fumarate reductase iron-sulfur subunit
MSTLQVSIYRYNPETDSAPYMQEFQVDTQGRDLMVLDVLHLMKEQDSGLAFRRSCREGVCGSDGMNMNGKNGLGCITPLSEVVKEAGAASVAGPAGDSRPGGRHGAVL